MNARIMALFVRICQLWLRLGVFPCWMSASHRERHTFSEVGRQLILVAHRHLPFTAWAGAPAAAGQEPARRNA